MEYITDMADDNIYKAGFDAGYDQGFQKGFHDGVEEAMKKSYIGAYLDGFRTGVIEGVRMKSAQTHHTLPSTMDTENHDDNAISSVQTKITDYFKLKKC